jgi:hypothetical protein
MPTGSGSGEPAMEMDSSGVYVAQNEDMIYEDPEWEWLEASQLLEGGQ